jgi:hypothetical protein
MGIVRFALKFPYTIYVLAALILFLGVSAIMVMPEGGAALWGLLHSRTQDSAH